MGNENDTVKLLRECDAGIKMGISSIDDVMDNVSSDEMKRMLTDCKTEHEKLKNEVREMLNKNGDEGKDPNVMAKSMSWIKTNAKIALDDSDKTIADLMTDGCNMGVKSLNRYINQYKAADEKSKNIAGRLSDLEERLAIDIRTYL